LRFPIRTVQICIVLATFASPRGFHVLVNFKFGFNQTLLIGGACLCISLFLPRVNFCNYEASLLQNFVITRRSDIKWNFLVQNLVIARLSNYNTLLCNCELLIHCNTFKVGTVLHFLKSFAPGIKFITILCLINRVCN